MYDEPMQPGGLCSECCFIWTGKCVYHWLVFWRKADGQFAGYRSVNLLSYAESSQRSKQLHWLGHSGSELDYLFDLARAQFFEKQPIPEIKFQKKKIEYVNFSFPIDNNGG